jgi:uroporphyrinogen-III synthase
MAAESTEGAVGSRVLVVRAQRDADEFLALLQGAGLRVQYLPIMTIDALDESPHIKRAIIDFDLYDCAVFISVHAARLALGWIDQYWPMLPSGMAYFAVGDQTAKVLRASGYQVTTPSTEFTSEGLLALPELQRLEGRRALIFCGVGGRQMLTEELARRGARVDRCPLYRRNIDAAKLSLARRQLSSTDCLVVHSGELLQSLAAPPPSIAESVPVVVPSPRLGEMADALGYCHVEIAESASPKAMCAKTCAILERTNGV